VREIGVMEGENGVGVSGGKVISDGVTC
jgi:hypothetical protein